MAALELLPGIDLLQSMRSVGYSFETAVADILDNSITAGARRVEVKVDVAQGRFVSIRDDGRGMSAAEALEALRLAGTARTGADGASSLGRFGLGLKTASLSQGRRVDVISRRGGVTTGLAWDMDMVIEHRRWVVDELDEERIANLPEYHRPLDGADGTVVLWTKLDYLTSSATKVETHLSAKVKSLHEHLGLVFHRYLADHGGLEIVLNGQPVDPVDPFLSDLPRTQRTPIQSIAFAGAEVRLQGFTLPFMKDIPAALRQRADLSTAMREYQGFYVYRNRRLISRGGWFNLRRKEELTKQARVMVDISDALDLLWQVDIRKARSEPPVTFREAVRPLMDSLVGRSEKVHTFRGRRASEPTPFARLWETVETRDGVQFFVNPDHPAVSGISARLDDQGRALLQGLLEDLAGCFPYYDTYLATAKSQLPETSRLSRDDVLERLRKLRGNGLSRAEVELIVLSAEPFRNVPGIEQLLKEAWEDAAE